MTTNDLTPQDIQNLRLRRNGVKTSFGTRNTLFDRYEEIYFMKDRSKPNDPNVDEKDWKVTVSPSGRDKVTGLKRILDTAEIHIKVKDDTTEDGKHPNSDKIETGLKKMLRISGEYKQARPERDTNLAAILYGPVVMSANSLDDLIEAKQGYSSAVDKYVVNQLQTIQKRTPFLIDTLNPRQSYPVWGKYGLVGHLQEYTMKGQEVVEEWSCKPDKFKADQDYIVQDFFYYNQRLVEANGETLFGGEWLTMDTKGNYSGVTSIPIFVRYAGGSTLFNKPEEQLQSFLYAYATGEWDKRENLFWTYLFTAIYMQGLSGPVILMDPDDDRGIEVDYTNGVKVIKAKNAKLENIQVIDGDVLQLRGLIDQQTGQSTIQEQTIGGPSSSATFSSYVTQLNAGKLPAIDPTEAQEQCYRDLFLHILQRIKAEGIENPLISPEDIPDDIELEVIMEADLQQDDLRNTQIVAQLKQSGINLSDEFLHSFLKISDSDAMFRQKAKEDIRAAVLGRIMQSPEIIDTYVAAAMGQKQQPPAPPQPPAPQPGMQGPPQMPGVDPAAMGEGMPMTDAVPMPQERM